MSKLARLDIYHKREMMAFQNAYHAIKEPIHLIQRHAQNVQQEHFALV